MSTAPRKRAPTRLVYVESSEEEADPTPGSSTSGPIIKPLLSSAEDAPFEPNSSPSPPPKATKPNLKRKSTAPSQVLSINDALMSRKPAAPTPEGPHSMERHSVTPAISCRKGLLEWYDKAKGVRAMPWRKDYDASLSPKEQTQRAYEVLVSEIMLQQTQV